jgi:hypothetical protein
MIPKAALSKRCQEEELSDAVFAKIRVRFHYWCGRFGSIPGQSISRMVWD